MSENATRFGFVNFAETWNGRLAMLGFVIGLGTELLTGQGILSQICLLYTSPSPRDKRQSRMPSSA